MQKKDPILIHVPHAATYIPKEELQYFVTPNLERELMVMTDHFTDDLFDADCEMLRFPISRLVCDPAFVPELDLVMYQDGELIGQNMFMRTAIAADDGRSIPIMTMGPICIRNEYKWKGYGKILLDYSLEKAAALGCGALCFEGNIGFYGKIGFKEASEYGIRYHGLPEGEDASFFLCRELIPGYLDGITGEYATPEGYLIDEQEAEEFDQNFPYKEKKKLPGQIF